MRTIALAIVGVLTVPAAAPGQDAARESLRAAARRGGRELARETVTTPPAAGWHRVIALRPGTLVRIVARPGRYQDAYVVSADEWVVTVVSLAHLTHRARRAVLDLVRKYPGALPVRGRQVRHGSLQLDPTGVTFDGVRQAGLSAVELSFARADIAEVKTRAADARAVAGAIGGGIVGGLIALQIMPGLAMKSCGSGCGGEKALMVLTAVGLPVAGGLVGGFAGGGSDRWRTIYAPSGSPP